MLALVLPLVFAAPVPKPKVPAFDLRTPDGTVLVAASDITAYDWGTHTLTVSEAAKAKLADDDPAGFVVCVGGKPVYAGKFWRATADEPCPGPVILLGDTAADLIRIDFNYGGPDPKDGEDARTAPTIREALEKAGKLTEKK
jgi:hypothetical protein